LAPLQWDRRRQTDIRIAACILLWQACMDLRSDWTVPLPIIFALLVLISLLVSVPVLP
jgi:hypothetical protein